MFNVYGVHRGILQTEKASSVRERPGSARQEITAAKKSRSTKSIELGKHSNITPVPTTLCSLYQDSQTMLMMLELFGITSRMCQELGTEGAKYVPYLSLLSAPTYLYHSSQKAYARFCLMYDAMKVKNYADAFFWAGRGLDAFGTAVGNVTKTLSGSIQIAGLTGGAFFSICLAHIIPNILIVVGSIGGLAQVAALYRSAAALKKLEETEETKPFAEFLRYLAGPLPRVYPSMSRTIEDAEKENAIRKSSREHQNFVTTHYTSDERYEFMQQRISHFNWKYSSDVEKDKITPYTQLLEKSSDLISDLLTHPEALETNSVSAVKLLGQLEERADSAELKGMITQNKETILRDLSQLYEKKEISDLAKSDIHRNLLYNALFILMTALIVTDGVIGIAAPDCVELVGLLSIASSVIDIGYVIFDKSVTADQFLRLERFIGTIKATRANASA